MIVVSIRIYIFVLRIYKILKFKFTKIVAILSCLTAYVNLDSMRHFSSHKNMFHEYENNTYIESNRKQCDMYEFNQCGSYSNSMNDYYSSKIYYKCFMRGRRPNDKLCIWVREFFCVCVRGTHMFHAKLHAIKGRVHTMTCMIVLKRNASIRFFLSLSVRPLQFLYLYTLLELLSIHPSIHPTQKFPQFLAVLSMSKCGYFLRFSIRAFVFVLQGSGSNLENWFSWTAQMSNDIMTMAHISIAILWFSYSHQSKSRRDLIFNCHLVHICIFHMNEINSLCVCVCVCTRLHEGKLCVRVHWCICAARLILFRYKTVWCLTVCISQCDRAIVSFMLITRIINDTRLILNLYRYFLDVYQSYVIFVYKTFSMWCDTMWCDWIQTDLIPFYQQSHSAINIYPFIWNAS